ncbi:MAG: hypothetical protein ABIO05_07755 [Ferruginibacter sp.]
MKILLDEWVTKHLKPHLAGHETHTVQEMNWGGIKNCNLLTLYVAKNFDILLRIDKNLKYQQNLELCPLSIVILNSSSSKVNDLITFLP